MFPTCKNSQKRVKNWKSTDKHSSFNGLIQEDIDLSDIYLAVTYNSQKLPRSCHRLYECAVLQPYRLKVLLVLSFETFKFDTEPKLWYD